ncbi:hypothetical protein FDP41_005275 [Naegleria fowleri]|uniref:GINS subunit domain-containing protein n=1 Tax=Naegleria fowleri TaxID=5763 RepID=A0A6A5BP43_NAEFO|nr:uncharacterized protein FDP41_005275 [Naegleria fowleri]KAF0975948.1 hypothetical protein FDP41_005275 [Naegleria fowleri]CAG4718732.1 unnamed protein product [Naegleria fowleri]
MSTLDLSAINNGRLYFDIDDIMASEERVAVVFNFTIPNIGKYIKTATALQKEHLKQHQLLSTSSNNNTNHYHGNDEEESVAESSDSEDETNKSNTLFEEKYIIERSTKVEVPFWLAYVCGSQGYVEVEVPRVFADLNYVTSNFEKASLSKVNRYFYEFGSALFKLMADIAINLKRDQELEALYIQRRSTLIETLVHRFKLFLRQAYRASNESSSSSFLTEQYAEFKSKLCSSELSILQMIQTDETNFVEWKHKSLGTYKLQYQKNYISSTDRDRDSDDDNDTNSNSSDKRRRNR